MVSYKYATSYYYEHIAAIPFQLLWNDGVPYIRSDLSGKSYYFDWGLKDYAILYVLLDDGRGVLVGWGLTHRGTVAISQVLQYFDSSFFGVLKGRAVLIEWIDSNADTEFDLGDEVNVIEVWP